MIRDRRLLHRMRLNRDLLEKHGLRATDVLVRVEGNVVPLRAPQQLLGGLTPQMLMEAIEARQRGEARILRDGHVVD